MGGAVKAVAKPIGSLVGAVTQPILGAIMPKTPSAPQAAAPTPSAPPPPPVVQQPTVPLAQQQPVRQIANRESDTQAPSPVDAGVQQARADERKRARRSGVNSTKLTGDLGVTSAPTTATKTLLGS